MTIEKSFEGGVIMVEGEAPFYCQECQKHSLPVQRNHVREEEKFGKENIAYNCPYCENNLFRLFIDG